MLLKKTLQIKECTLQNRLVMPPMHTGKSPDGKVNPALCEYYVQRAAGGSVGLIITEFSYISLQGKAGATQLSIAQDEDIESHAMLVDAIHAAGSKAFAQIHHAGSTANAAVTSCEVVAPSAVRHPWAKPDSPLPRALTEAEILGIEGDFVSAALRAKAAHYDGVELHGAHGYLLNQFYSPLTNQRHDAYGCDNVENRVRIITETLQKVRAAVGPDYPIAVRLGGCDYSEGGSTIDDCVAACHLLEAAGADLLDISGGMRGYTHPDDKQPGWFRDMSAPVKSAVQIPVLVTGGVTAAAQAETLLEQGAADLIGVGRALFKDGDWAKKEMA